MHNKELFITTYLEKIADKFNINKDITFDEIHADDIIPCSTDGKKYMRRF